MQPPLDKRAVRRRLSPEAARALALDAARRILAEEGPQGLTLSAVAAAAGMTHGNLTHHFGSIAGLQAALIVQVGERLASDVAAATLRFRAGEATARDLVDLVFDSLARDDHGRLVAWLASSGQVDRLQAVFEVVASSVRLLRAGESNGSKDELRGAGAMAAVLLSGALSASFIGGPLTTATGLAPDALRLLAARQLEALRVG